MWLLGWRDLQWRRRRFLIAVVATALVFAMTLLMTVTGSTIADFRARRRGAQPVTDLMAGAAD